MKKILSLLVVAAMLVCLLTISAFAAEEPPMGPPPGGAPPGAPPAAATLNFVSDKGAALATAPAEGGTLVFAIVCSPPTDIVSISASGGTLETQKSTAGGPSTPQGTINGLWTLSGITGDVTVTLVLNTQEGAAPPVFTFGAEAAAAIEAAASAMGPPPDGAAPPEGGAPPDGAAPPEGGAPPAAPVDAPPPVPAPVTFVSDKGATLASATADGETLVFGITCSPPTDITSFDVSGGTLETQQSTAGGPSKPQGTINGIWTLSGITGDVTVTLVLNTKDGADPPVFFFGADEAAAGVGSGGMGAPPPGAAPPGEPAPELAGPPTGGHSALPILVFCLLGLAVSTPVLIKKISK